jgi:hypothetical protein
VQPYGVASTGHGTRRRMPPGVYGVRVWEGRLTTPAQYELHAVTTFTQRPPAGRRTWRRAARCAADAGCTCITFIAILHRLHLAPRQLSSFGSQHRGGAPDPKQPCGAARLNSWVHQAGLEPGMYHPGPSGAANRLDSQSRPVLLPGLSADGGRVSVQHASRPAPNPHRLKGPKSRSAPRSLCRMRGLPRYELRGSCRCGTGGR